MTDSKSVDMGSIPLVPAFKDSLKRLSFSFIERGIYGGHITAGVL